MPKGLIWLAIGTLIGVGLGWLVYDELVLGGVAGFAVALVLLLAGHWLGGRGSGEINVSGR